MPIAFKEWAVTVRALAEGEQLVALRKGGIREENKHFEVEHEQFFLYPPSTTSGTTWCASPIIPSSAEPSRGRLAR
jgi:hypothetical protein